MATIQTQLHLAHSPARVWRALTDTERVGRWLMPTTPVRAEVGATFSLDAGQWGAIQCEVLACEPEVLFVYTWKNGVLDTTVTWRLFPEGDGTRLELEHAGFDLDNPQAAFAYQSMSGGWSGFVLPRLAGLCDAERE